MTRIVILAGGKSSRFGSNKALAPWKGSTIIETILEKVSKVTNDVAISVGASDPYPEINIKKIFDRHPGLGALGALHACLMDQSHDRVMLIACDMPLIEPTFVKFMTDIETWAPAIVPYANGKYEPLHAIYHRSLLPIVEYLIGAKRLKMTDLLEMIPVRPVKEDETGRLFCFNRIFVNINTKAQYENHL